MDNKENRNFTTGNLLKKIILYLIPLFLASALQLLFTTVDIFTVKQFGGGNTSSGAIGSTTNLLNLILCTFWGVTNGASIIIANAKGANNPEKAKRAIGNTTLLMLIASVIVMAFGAIFAKPLLVSLKTNEEFLDKASTYIMIYFLGTPFVLLFNAGSATLRAFGDSRRPFIAVTISGVVNVILDFTFVYFLKMDVAGVALATILSQGIAMVIVYLYLIKDKRLFANFEKKHIRLYKSETREILFLGITNGLQGFIFNFTNVFIQKCVNELGPAAVIGKAAASNIEGYEYALLNAISVTCLISVSQNYGAKNRSRIRKSLLYCIWIELGFVAAFDLIVILLHKPLSMLTISQGEETTEMAMKYAYQSLLIMGIPYALCGIAECFTSFLRGMKYSITPTLVSLLCIVGVRMIFMCFLFRLEQFHDFYSLIMTYPISWSLCCVTYIPISLILGKRKFKEITSFKCISSETTL